MGLGLNMDVEIQRSVTPPVLLCEAALASGPGGQQHGEVPADLDVRKDNVPVGALPAAFPLVGFEFNLSRMCRCQHGQHRSRGVAGPDWPCSGRERDAVDCALWSVQTPQHVSYAPPDSGLEGGRATGSPAYQSGHSSFSRCRSA